MHRCLLVALVFLSWLAGAASAQQVVDLPTRPGVTQRLLVVPAPAARATLIMLAGGHGGLQVQADGSLQWGAGNFVVRTRALFVDAGFHVVLLDAPSDRQTPPFLSGNRQTPEHVADVRATIAWARKTYSLPVWLVSTSRGTQSAAYLATELPGSDGPDGLVLTSSILTDNRSRAVPALPLEKIRIPVLVVHHEQDGCKVCAFSDMPQLMARLTQAPHRELLSFTGGTSRGDPCEAFAYHGYNGIEADVVAQIARWIRAH